ncbi:hypothetical protein KSP40_PGU012927 [Platanthera guangdongensis]|uniref:Uncharacterized protein n=1 Tax=Platanthera guangdongensis TaxID=2320717 RepID=A0ABR2MUG3_9ASPA
MASAAFSLAPFFLEQTICRPSKEVSTAFPGHGHRRDILKSASVLVGSPVEEKGLTMNLLPTYSLLQISIPMVEKPFLMDMQDTLPDSMVFSLGIADQCARCENIRKFLFSMSDDEKVIDTSLMSDLMGLDTATMEFFDMLSINKVGVYDADHILHLARHIPKPLLEFIEDRSNSSNITLNPDGRMLLTGAESEMKDLFSVATEFNVLKSFTTSNKQSMVIPYFTRGGFLMQNEMMSMNSHTQKKTEQFLPHLTTVFDSRSKGSLDALVEVLPCDLEVSWVRVLEAASYKNSITVPTTQTFSPADIKLKPSPKKKGKHGLREREFYEKNYFRACENFLSLVVDKKRTSMDVIALKKSGPEITQLLSQFGAGVAGTGLAIILSTACKTASGRAPLNAAKFLNIGLGFGFLYLSWSVARLQDAAAFFTRSTGKLKLTEEEMSARLDRSVKEVLYRAVALTAIALLTLA